MSGQEHRRTWRSVGGHGVAELDIDLTETLIRHAGGIRKSPLPTSSNLSAPNKAVCPRLAPFFDGELRVLDGRWSPKATGGTRKSSPANVWCPTRDSSRVVRAAGAPWVSDAASAGTLKGFDTNGTEGSRLGYSEVTTSKATVPVDFFLSFDCSPFFDFLVPDRTTILPPAAVSALTS